MESSNISTQALPAGTRIEEFVIESVLGSGGFGITYLARDTALGRQVVIKENLPVQFCFRDPSSLTVAPRHSQSDDADNFQWSLENFSKEAAMLASLHHPGIVQVLRSFQAFGTAYFVMPYVEGVTLEDLLQSRQQEGQSFNEEELRGLIERVLAALDHLHQRGIYHRDIKPGNILITSEGTPVLIDFGSARQRLSERSMTVVESAGYTPFEQLQTRGRIGPWSDLYAFGATLAKVITGAAPPKATDRAFDDPWTPLAQGPKWSARYSAAFLTGVDRAMAVRIEERFQDAEEWLEVLKNHTDSAAQLNPSRVPPPSDQPPHPTSVPLQYGQKQTLSPSKKPKRFALATMAAVLAVVAVGGVALIGRGRGNTGSDEATTKVESSVVGQTAVETPPDKIPEQVEARPPAVAPSASTPIGVPLTTELPPELIEGTPKPMNVPNLVAAPTKAPEFLVPGGTVLLSRGKPVTSSDDAPIIGSLSLITDGDKEAGEGYFVELLDGTQWVQIDLEKSAALSAIWVWHFHSQKRAYNDVIIQVSDDAEFKTGVTNVYSNDYDDSSKLGKGRDNPYVETRFGKLVDAKGACGRYVRLYSNGNTSNEFNHYIEVEVFGIPESIEGSAPPRSAKNRDLRQADAEAVKRQADVLAKQKLEKEKIEKQQVAAEQAKREAERRSAAVTEHTSIADSPAEIKVPATGIVTTRSGLVSKILKAGTGTQYPKEVDTVTVHYSGWTTDGKMFDSSVKRGQPASFPLNGVIKGWTEGVQLMVVGEKRRFWIPSALAYGENPGGGRPGGILVFEVELLGIKAAPTAPTVPEDVAGAPASAERTTSGIASRLLVMGTGTIHPKAADQVKVHYSGWTTDGKLFDSSVLRNEPIVFPLNQVIPGWTEGVQLMVEGEKRRLWIPAKLAYGDNPPQGAPAGTLVFDVELIEIVK